VAGIMIGELARQAGVATSALRYYERAGLLPSPALSLRCDGARWPNVKSQSSMRLPRASVKCDLFSMPVSTANANGWKTASD
jgi:hypothetical protein